MSPLKKGQKLTDNPKDVNLSLRLTKAEAEDLQYCAAMLNTSRTDVINRGIQKIKNEKSLVAQAFVNMDRFAYDEEYEKILLTKIDTVYNMQGEVGLAKLLDSFIFFTGVENALKIVEDYMNESSIN